MKQHHHEGFELLITRFLREATLLLKALRSGQNEGNEQKKVYCYFRKEGFRVSQGPSCCPYYNLEKIVQYSLKCRFNFFHASNLEPIKVARYGRRSFKMLLCKRDLFSLLSESSLLHTVRNLHFLSKNSTLISRENRRFFFG